MTVTPARASASVVTVLPVDEQQRRQLKVVTGRAEQAVESRTDVADGDLLLAAAGADDRVHGWLS